MKVAVIPVAPYSQNSVIFWCKETMKGMVTYPGGDVELIQKAIADQSITVEKLYLTDGNLDHGVALRSLHNVWVWPLKSLTVMINF